MSRRFNASDISLFSQNVSQAAEMFVRENNSSQRNLKKTISIESKNFLCAGGKRKFRHHPLMTVDPVQFKKTSKQYFRNNESVGIRFLAAKHFILSYQTI